jgi:uncharacterized HAD superfamily protein
MEFNENGNRKVINVDVDGVLTNGEKFWDVDPSPNTKAISHVRELYKQGNIIIIHTARMWECAPDTIAWLTKHHVPFHCIYMAKGGADIYIDDKYCKSLDKLLIQTTNNYK